jgi:uncharacterized protein YlzI (FlbEa/FlbD family)/TolB-like protein
MKLKIVTILFMVLMLKQISFSGIPATFTAITGAERQAKFIELRNDSVHLVAELPGGKSQNIIYPKNGFRSIKLQSGEIIDLSLSNYDPSQKTIVKPSASIPLSNNASTPEPEATAREATFYLNSGMSKTADFIGFEGDQILIRGTLKNGKIQTVKAPRSMFKQIVFADGSFIDPNANDSEIKKAETIPDTNITLATPQPAIVAIPETSLIDSTNDPKKESLLIEAVPATPSSVGLKAPVRYSERSTLILPFKGNSSEEKLDVLGDAFRHLMVNTGQWDILDYDYSQPYLECENRPCQNKLAQEQGLGFIVHSKVQEIDGNLIISAELQNAQSGKIIKSVSDHCKCSFDVFQKTKLPNLVKDLVATPSIAMTKSESPGAKTSNKPSLTIETFPEGAEIMINGKKISKVSPVYLADQDTGSYLVEAHWYVANNLWAGRQSVNLKAADQAKITLRLKKAWPKLTIKTTPPGAEFYVDQTPNPSIAPRDKSPYTLKGLQPGPHQISLFKSGYKDTTLNVQIDAINPGLLEVTLHEETDSYRLEAQNAFIKIRSKKQLGKNLIYTSLAPMVVAATLYYMASLDFDEAAKYKSQLEVPSARSGDQYEALKVKNKEAFEAGDLKTKMANGFGALGILGLGLGMVLWF